MKNIKINPNEIIIKYETNEEAKKLYDWIKFALLEEYAKIEDNVIIYDISSHTDKFHPLMRIVRKIVYDSDDLSDELYSSAFSTDKYNYRLNCRTNYSHNKIFRVTPIKEDGTLGIFDFGIHQYTTFISFIETNNPNEFVFLSSKGHVKEDNPNQLKFEKGFSNGSILIEIGEIQF